jgi:hypothetical protein
VFTDDTDELCRKSPELGELSNLVAAVPFSHSGKRITLIDSHLLLHGKAREILRRHCSNVEGPF